MWLFAFHSVSGVSHRCTGNAFGENSLWVSNCKPWVRQLSLWLRAKGRTWWRTESCSLEPCLCLGRWKVARVLCSSMWMICLSWQNTRVMSRPNLIWLGPMRKAAFFFEGFSRGYNVVLRGKHGTSWHSHVFHNVSKAVLSDRGNTFALFFVAGAALWTKMWCSSLARGMPFCVAGTVVGDALHRTPCTLDF